MKMLVVILFSMAAMAQSGIEALETDTLESPATKPATLGTVAKIEQQIVEGMKMKCDIKFGCALFVDGGKGYDVKVTVGAGEGPNYGVGGNGGGINIYSGSASEQYYGIAVTFVYSNYVCTRYVPEGSFMIVETYQRLMASPEYVNKVFSAWKKGEDMPTPEAVKTALSVLATVKPTQANCGQRLNNN
ncbi:MAG: hypothetical protein JNL11_02585 [Bdellovibrionaceae bacterium]|nr:hypothetical protein [Pseudobdellovibrionaceae bacterium]